MRNAQVQILNAVDTTTQTGLQIDVNQVVSASFTPVFGDVTAAGTVKLQCSNDLTLGQTRNQFIPKTWNDIPNATSTIVAGVGPAIVINSMCFSYIRVVYTRTSGGTTTVVVNMNSLSV